MLKKIEDDQYVSSYDMAKKLDIHHQTHLKHLKASGYENVWRIINRTTMLPSVNFYRQSIHF